MYYLGLDYIISSILWLFAISAFVYTFREKIFRFFNNKGTFNEFVHELKKYLKKTYADIKFDLSIIEQTKKEASEELRKSIVVEEIISQYKDLPLSKLKMPKATDASKLWSSYTFNCTPNKSKLPSDWSQRINAVLTRDHQKCFRCSTKLKISTTTLHLIVPLENGGKYQLENLIALCSDCAKCLSGDEKKINNLKIKDNLYDIVEDY